MARQLTLRATQTKHTNSLENIEILCKTTTPPIETVVVGAVGNQKWNERRWKNKEIVSKTRAPPIKTVVLGAAGNHKLYEKHANSLENYKI